MKFKTIIFDLDGTLGDTLPLCIAAFKTSIEPLLGKQISEAEIIATFGPSEEGTIRKLIPEHEQEGVEAYLRHYKDLHHMCPAPFDGIAELLALLKAKQVQLAMVTGKGVHSTKLSLVQFSLSEYFELVETGKPDGPDKVNGINRVIIKWNATLAETLYIGDAPSDITACKQVGIPIAAVAWAGTTHADELIALKPDWLFYKVDEFKEWIADKI